MLPRRGHSLTAVDTTADHELTMVTLFGGSSKPSGTYLHNLQKLADTTVMIFGKLIELVSVINVPKLCSLIIITIVIEYDGIDDSKWTKVCSVTNTQLGTKDSVRAQIKKSQGITRAL